jgi:hypothetical protein
MIGLWDVISTSDAISGMINPFLPLICLFLLFLGLVVFEENGPETIIHLIVQNSHRDKYP